MDQKIDTTNLNPVLRLEAYRISDVLDTFNLTEEFRDADIDDVTWGDAEHTMIYADRLAEILGGGAFDPDASDTTADRQNQMIDWLRAQGRSLDRKSTRLNSSHVSESRMPSSA